MLINMKKQNTLIKSSPLKMAPIPQGGSGSANVSTTGIYTGGIPLVSRLLAQHSQLEVVIEGVMLILLKFADLFTC